MKFKHFISFVLVMFVLVQHISPINATTITDTDMGAIVLDEAKNNRIDGLFALRNKLELDYDANKTEIDQIDQQLALLGVETVSYGEVFNKLGSDVLPAIGFDSTNTTRWTSRRVVVTYYGQHFELQILEGVPISANSPLRKDAIVVSYAREGIVAGVTNAIKVIGATAFGGTPVIGELLSIGITAYEALSAIGSSLSSSTVIDNVNGSATISLTTHMKYILVKPYDAIDEGHQATCYIGSSVSYNVTTVSVVDILVDNELVTYHEVNANVTDSTNSIHYNDYSVPAKTYYDYKYNGITRYNDDYYLRTLTMNIFGTNKTINVPYEIPLLHQ